MLENWNFWSNGKKIAIVSILVTLGLALLLLVTCVVADYLQTKEKTAATIKTVNSLTEATTSLNIKVGKVYDYTDSLNVKVRKVYNYTFSDSAKKMDSLVNREVPSIKKLARRVTRTERGQIFLRREQRAIVKRIKILTDASQPPAELEQNQAAKTPDKAIIRIESNNATVNGAGATPDIAPAPTPITVPTADYEEAPAAKTASSKTESGPVCWRCRKHLH